MTSVRAKWSHSVLKNVRLQCGKELLCCVFPSLKFIGCREWMLNDDKSWIFYVCMMHTCMCSIIPKGSNDFFISKLLSNNTQFILTVSKKALGTNHSCLRCFYKIVKLLLSFYIFWIFIRALVPTTFQPLHILNGAQRPNLTGYPFTNVLIFRKLPS